MVMKLPPNELARVLQLRGWCGSEIALDYILSLLYKFRANSLKFAPRVGLWNCGILVAWMTMRKGYLCCLYQGSTVRLRCDQGCHLEAQLLFKQGALRETAFMVHIELKAGREARGAEQEAQICGCWSQPALPSPSPNPRWPAKHPSTPADRTALCRGQMCKLES